MPGANLTSFGAVRDIEKWPARDRRSVCRDVINFEEYNPYVAGAMIEAVNILHGLEERDPDAPVSPTKSHHPRHGAAPRTETLQQSHRGGVGGDARQGSLDPHRNGGGRWLDLAGQYITHREVASILDAVDRGELTTTAAVDNRFRVFAVHYDDYAHSWAVQVYASMLGHMPTAGGAGRRRHRRPQRPRSDAPHRRRPATATARSTWP